MGSLKEIIFTEYIFLHSSSLAPAVTRDGVDRDSGERAFFFISHEK